jgi:hypothetical protein
METWTPPPWLLPLIVAALLVPTIAGFAFAGPTAGFLLGGLTLGVLVLLAARAIPREPIAPGPLAAGDAMLAVGVAPIETRAIAERIAELAARAQPDAERPKVVALAPVRPTARQRWLSIRGDTREVAQAEADRAVRELAAAGCEASGRIVDENPVRAVADAAALSGGAAGVVFVVDDEEHDLEIEEIRSRIERPVHKLRVAGEAGPRLS